MLPSYFGACVIAKALQREYVQYALIKSRAKMNNYLRKIRAEEYNATICAMHPLAYYTLTIFTSPNMSHTKNRLAWKMVDLTVNLGTVSKTMSSWRIITRIHNSLQEYADVAGHCQKRNTRNAPVHGVHFPKCRMKVRKIKGFGVEYGQTIISPGYVFYECM